jgi:hypothetical protein
LNGKLEEATEKLKLKAKVYINNSSDKLSDPWSIGALDHLMIAFQVSIIY